MHTIFECRADTAYTGFAGGDYKLLHRGTDGTLMKAGDIQALCWTKDKDSDFVVGSLIMYKLDQPSNCSAERYIETFFYDPRDEKVKRTTRIHVILPPGLQEGKSTHFVGYLEGYQI
jgi:hypothetical protein